MSAVAVVEALDAPATKRRKRPLPDDPWHGCTYEQLEKVIGARVRDACFKYGFLDHARHSDDLAAECWEEVCKAALKYEDRGHSFITMAHRAAGWAIGHFVEKELKHLKHQTAIIDHVAPVKSFEVEISSAMDVVAIIRETDTGEALRAELEGHETASPQAQRARNKLKRRLRAEGLVA